MLIDSEKLKQDIAKVMPSRIEVNLIVDSQPEAIVRCKDCKWNSGYGRGMYVCFCTCYKTGTPHKDDWFCADGERKDGDGDG